MKEDYLKIDTHELMKELRTLSDQYNHWYSELLKFEHSVKTLSAELYLQYKHNDTGEKMTVKEIESKSLTNNTLTDQRLKLIVAQSNYMKSKTGYNNKQTEISLLQSELKRELTLHKKEI